LGHWDFSLTWSFRPHYGPGVDSAFNRNEYQKYFLGSKGGRCLCLTTLPPSCADYREILWPSTSWSPKSLSRPVMGLLREHFLVVFLIIFSLKFKVMRGVNESEVGKCACCDVGEMKTWHKICHAYGLLSPSVNIKKLYLIKTGQWILGNSHIE
jgi:hypothetical protein